jgi:hypothetical protein
MSLTPALVLLLLYLFMAQYITILQKNIVLRNKSTSMLYTKHLNAHAQNNIALDTTKCQKFINPQNLSTIRYI